MGSLTQLHNLGSGGASTSNISGRKVLVTIGDTTALPQSHRDAYANAVALRLVNIPEAAIGNHEMVIAAMIGQLIALFPDFKGPLDRVASLDIVWEPITAATLQPLVDGINHVVTDTSPRPALVSPRLVGISRATPTIPDLAEVNSHDGRVAQLALCIFAMVKQWTAKGGTKVFRNSRPRALIGAGSLSGRNTEYVQGTYQPSEHYLKAINSTFEFHTSLRGVILEELIDWHRNTQMTTDQRIMSSVTLMFKWHGMGFVRFIRKMVHSRPDIAKVPQVAAELGEFEKEQTRLRRVARHKRAFVKAMHGSAAELFRRNDYPLLIALSVKVEVAGGNATLANYHVPDEYQTLADKIFAGLTGTPVESEDEEDVIQ